MDITKTAGYIESRDKAHEEVDLDLRKPVGQLLKDVHHEALFEKYHDRDRGIIYRDEVGRLLGLNKRKASLDVVLALMQEASSKRMERYTFWLIVLTVAISIFTLVLIGIELARFPSVLDFVKGLFS